MEAQHREPIPIALVDDQVVMRGALGDLLEETGEAKIVCSTEHGDESLSDLQGLGAAVMLIGFDAQLHDPIASVHRASRAYPKLPLCALVASGQPSKVHEALAAGCGGAVSSGATVDVVVAALRSLAVGQAYVDPNLGGELLSAELAARNHRRK